jgi:hypothetical protein
MEATPASSAGATITCKNIGRTAPPAAIAPDGKPYVAPKLYVNLQFQDCSDGKTYWVSASGESAADLSCTCTKDSQQTKSGKCAASTSLKEKMRWEETQKVGEDIAAQYCGFSLKLSITTNNSSQEPTL